MARQRSGALHIAGWNTADDWRRLRKRLVPGGDRALWESAYKDYFYKRLKLRYLDPIRTLQDNGTYQGEGFSIVAIQCTLIEFLESAMQGRRYRFLRKGEKVGPHEYSSSANIFVAFLSTREPFSRTFDADSAFDFYLGVRCGLLHEARTKNDWTIWARSSDGAVANVRKRVVYRDDFQSALLAFIDAYGERLLTDNTLQEAFIRKFDSLCE